MSFIPSEAAIVLTCLQEVLKSQQVSQNHFPSRQCLQRLSSFFSLHERGSSSRTTSIFIYPMTIFVSHCTCFRDIFCKLVIFIFSVRVLFQFRGLVPHSICQNFTSISSESYVKIYMQVSFLNKLYFLLKFYYAAKSPC